MEYLASNCYVCSLSEAVARLKSRDVPENTVVLTFDDGYRDNYTNAFPVLKKFSLPATVFLATDAIGTARVLWHDRVFAAFSHTRECFVEHIARDGRKYRLTTAAEKRLALRDVLQWLWSVPEQEMPFWIARLIDKLRVADRNEDASLMLNWDQVKTMAQAGISFGSHTVSHPILANVAADKAAAEIYESKRVIEENLGRPAFAFAYPNGRRQDFTESIKAMVREAGYTCAVSTIFGVNAHGQDLFEMRRGSPWEGDLPSFATKLAWYKLES